MLALIESGYSVTIFDNLDNSYEAVFDRMKELAGDKARNMKFVKVRGGTTPMIFRGPPSP